MPAQYVKPYLGGQKNDFRDAEAIAEAVQRPRMRFVPTKSVEQLDLPRLPQRIILTLMEKVPKSLALTGTECQTHFRSAERWHHSKPYA